MHHDYSDTELVLPVLEAYSRLNIVIFYNNNNNKVQLAKPGSLAKWSLILNRPMFVGAGAHVSVELETVYFCFWRGPGRIELGQHVRRASRASKRTGI